MPAVLGSAEAVPATMLTPILKLTNMLQVASLLVFDQQMTENDFGLTQESSIVCMTKQLNYLSNQAMNQKLVTQPHF